MAPSMPDQLILRRLGRTEHATVPEGTSKRLSEREHSVQTVQAFSLLLAISAAAALVHCCCAHVPMSADRPDGCHALGLTFRWSPVPIGSSSAPSYAGRSR